jgi:hypothetical protein
MTVKPGHRKALAHLRLGRWDQAHAIVMDMRDKLAFRIHGLVHRAEGDPANARYWYKKAGVRFAKSKRAARELHEIAAALSAAAATRRGRRRSPPRRSGSRRSRA